MLYAYFCDWAPFSYVASMGYLTSNVHTRHHQLFYRAVRKLSVSSHAALQLTHAATLTNVIEAVQTLGVRQQTGLAAIYEADIAYVVQFDTDLVTLRQQSAPFYMRWQFWWTTAPIVLTLACAATALTLRITSPSAVGCAHNSMLWVAVTACSSHKSN